MDPGHINTPARYLFLSNSTTGTLAWIQLLTELTIMLLMLKIAVVGCVMFLHLTCPACLPTTASSSCLPAPQLLPGSNSWHLSQNGNPSNCVLPVWFNIDFTRMNIDSRYCQNVDWWLIPLTAGRSFKNALQQRLSSELTFGLRAAIILRTSIQRWQQFVISAAILRRL